MNSPTQLPIANARQVRQTALDLVRHYRKLLGKTIGLNIAAAGVGLIGPALIGSLVDQLSGGGSLRAVDRLAGFLLLAVICQTVLTWAARRSSFIAAERIFARLRERFIDQVVQLPLSTVEEAGTGDLVTRTTRDIEALSETVRTAIPAMVVSGIASILTFGAAFFTGWRVALPTLIGAPVLILGTRWYLRRAPAGYLRENASYANLNGAIAETLDSARTVTALSLGPQRYRLILARLRACFLAEKYTLFLRTVWFPTVDIGFYLPVAISLAWGSWLVSGGEFLGGSASIGEVTAVTLYILALIDPIDDFLSSLDTIQVGMASFARIIGIDAVPPDRISTNSVPRESTMSVNHASFSYHDRHQALSDINLQLRSGERLAVVGPSGAGKSTLARLLAGIHPPDSGSVTVGGIPLVELPLQQLHSEVALVTQEQHIFVGTIADNLRIALPQASNQELLAALDSVAASTWVDNLPQGLETLVGSGGFALTPAQEQQLALARLVLKDPHTLILDEATSLLDTRAARDLERGLSAVLQGRTVVAIAHRLHTAHDADRVAVLEDGRLVELGTHDELLAAGQSYAKLWNSWTASPHTETKN